MNAALLAALPALACPHCGQGLSPTDTGAGCPAGHRFDTARHGQLSLLAGAPHPGGDTAAMVAARHAFLSAGHYRPIATALADATHTDVPGCLLDLGAGTGHYLSAVLDSAPGRIGLALDISRYALRRAARAHPRMAAIGADTWTRLPVRDGAVAAAINVFAPRNPAELHRVLAAGATLAVVTPTANHLRELAAPLGMLGVEPAKRDRLGATLGATLTPAGSRLVEFTMHLDHDAVTAVAGMGPTAFHVDPATLADRVARLPDPTTVTASVTITSYRR